MGSKHQLGDLQLAIMRVIWEQGEATVSQVHAALLPRRGLAPTTIATMLRKMERKGVVRHHRRGRSFVYRATVEEGEVQRSMVADLVSRLFDGDPRQLVSHLLSEGEIDPGELEELRRRLRREDGDER